MGNVEVKVKLDRVYKKLSPGNITKGQVAMANQMMMDMNHFVPRKEGTLRMDTKVIDQGRGIKYGRPYARAQYYGKSFRKGTSFTFKRYSTPGTGPRWDKKAKGIYGKSWPKVFIKGASI